MSALALAALTAASAAVGYWASDRNVPQRIEARIVAPAMDAVARRLPGWKDELRIPWVRVLTNRHELEIARFRVARDEVPLAWALAPVGDHLVFSSRHGQLSVLTSANALAPLDLRTPMRLDALREAPVSADPVLDFGELRTFDLLAVETASGRYDLYASHVRYADGCFEVAVSRTELEADSAGVRAVTGAWRDVYVVRPCLEVKYTGMRFAGHEGGGRLVMKDPDTLLLSVGVFQFDDVAAGQLAGQDPTTDLGKIIAITLSTGEARIYASGLRNPQGLLAASDGGIWETEHGPRGGDEVNRIEDGANYGWPIVTYGMDYAVPPADWPHNPTPGRHDGYAEPKVVFTPSIGVSNIIEPDAREFDRWDDSFVVAALTSGSIHVLKRRGDQIISAEQVEMRARLRDIVSLADGRIALATDSGELILMRNAQKRHADSELLVTGMSSLAAPLPEDRWWDLSDFGRGAQTFSYQCSTCHSLTGELGVGPPLDGLFGRRVGAVEGYGYSDALRTFNGTWNGRLLRSYLLEPGRRFQGTIMPQSGVQDHEMADLVRYLAAAGAAPSADP